MTKTNRREILRIGSAAIACPVLAMLPMGSRPEAFGETTAIIPSNENANENNLVATMKIHYLEMVTPDVDAICKTYEEVHGLEFGSPEPTLGNARTAPLPNGTTFAVRAPLRQDEQPVVRPYFLVEDIAASVAQAKAAGAKIALPPMKLPGYGTCAVFIQGGIEHGLWES